MKNLDAAVEEAKRQAALYNEGTYILYEDAAWAVVPVSYKYLNDHARTLIVAHVTPDGRVFTPMA